jgi:type II secretory pathway component PulC
MVRTGMLPIFSRLPFSWRGVGALVVGVLLARWTWILFAPHSLVVLPPKPDVDGSVTNSLFGIAAVSSVAAVNNDAALGNVHLVGVFSGKKGFAVLKIDDKTQRGVALGEDVIKGAKLVEVAVDHVLIEYNGMRQRVNLEIKSAINKENDSLDHASVIPGVKEAVAGWSQAQQELQKKQELPNAH